MAITVLTDGATASNTRTLSWTIPTLASGDLIVVSAMTWDQGNTLNTPSGTGLSFTLRAEVNTGGRSHVYIWTAVASSGGSSVAVTSSILAGGACMHTGTLIRFPTADGYSLAGTPNTATSTSADEVSLSGTSGSIGVVALGDWNGNNGSTRVWHASATEDLYAFSAGDNTQYYAHCTLTGATTTVGLSTAPGGFQPAIAAMEVLAGGGGTTNYNGTAAVSATDSISSAGTVGKVATAAVAATATIAAAGVVGKVATAALAATATLASAGTVAGGAVSSDAALASTATVAAAGVVGTQTTATVAATDTIAAAGIVGTQATSSITGTATLAAAGTVTAAGTGSATLAATDTITAAGSVGTSTGSTLSTTDTITATGAVGKEATATVGATATLTAAGTVVAGGSSTAAIAATDTITAAGTLGLNAPAAVTVTVVITATGHVGVSAGATLAATATITASDRAERDITATASLVPRPRAAVDRGYEATLPARRWKATTTP